MRPIPAWMSSMMKSAPCSRARSWTWWSQSGLATLTPPSACTTSTRKAAGGSSPLDGSFSAAAYSASAVSPPGAVSKGRRWMFSSGTPAQRRKASFAVAAREPRVMPWKPWLKATISRRPVAARASFIAASTAFEPVGPMNCRRWSMPRGARTTSWKRSTKSRLVVV